MTSEQKTYPINYQERNDYRNEKLEGVRTINWGLFNHSPRFIIQLIPETEQLIDLQKPENQKIIDEKLKPFYIKGFDYEPDNISVDSYTVKNTYAYATLYKDGRLEIVRASYSSSGGKSEIFSSDDDIKFIPVEYEQEVKDAIKLGLDLLKALEINPPLFGAFTILEAKGYRLRRASKYSQKEIEAENNDIKGREFIISSYEAVDKNLDNYINPDFDYIRRIVSWR